MARIKNVFGEPWKDTYADIRISPRTTNSNGMACSHNKIAFPWDVGSGGLVAVINLDKYGKKLPILKLKGHRAMIQDMEFNYFNLNILATSSDDATVLVWDVPDFSTSEDIAQPIASLSGHNRKVICSTWNPIADFILASASSDSNICFWNVSAEAKICNTKIAGNLSNCKWHSNGSVLITGSKEGHVTIIDPKSNKNIEFSAHEQSKATMVNSLDGPAGSVDYIVTTGFLGNQVRLVKLWDLRKTDNCVKEIILDSSPSPFIPSFDDNLGILTLTAKGDSTVRCFNFYNGDLIKNGEMKSKSSIKSFAWAPKIVCNQDKCELGRVLVNEEFKLIQPISLLVSRRNVDDHSELYPQISSFTPRVNSYEWAQGKRAERIFVPHDPSIMITELFCKFTKGLPIKREIIEEVVKPPVASPEKPMEPSTSISTQPSDTKMVSLGSMEMQEAAEKKDALEPSMPVPPPVTCAPTSTITTHVTSTPQPAPTTITPPVATPPPSVTPPSVTTTAVTTTPPSVTATTGVAAVTPSVSATSTFVKGGPNVHKELAELLTHVSEKLMILDQKIQAEIDACNIKNDLKNIVDAVNKYLN